MLADYALRRSTHNAVPWSCHGRGRGQGAGRAQVGPLLASRGLEGGRVTRLKDTTASRFSTYLRMLISRLAVDPARGTHYLPLPTQPVRPDPPRHWSRLSRRSYSNCCIWALRRLLGRPPSCTKLYQVPAQRAVPAPVPQYFSTPFPRIHHPSRRSLPLPLLLPVC
jgi:hypothetical protein